MELSQGVLVDRAVKLIRAIGLAEGDVDRFENCEMISDMVTEDMLELVDDRGLVETIKRMRDLHAHIRRANYEVYIEMAKKLFAEIGDRDNVLKYHELEQICQRIRDETLESIDDENLRKTLISVKRIHDNIAERKAELIRRMPLI
ncbi:MAG: hypothetical protein ACE5GD_07770 [Candidatus Geothermarchaeales archaeon]